MIPKLLLIASPLRPGPPEIWVISQEWVSKLEARHGFAIRVQTPYKAVLDSSSIEQNTGAKELRSPQARTQFERHTKHFYRRTF